MDVVESVDHQFADDIVNLPSQDGNRIHRYPRRNSKAPIKFSIESLARSQILDNPNMKVILKEK